MIVIQPTAFAVANLISTSAVEATTTWSAGTSYSIGNRARYEYQIWESLTDANVGNVPSSSPTHWILVGPDNVTAMFDSQTSTETTATSPLSVTVATGTINALALVGLSDATELHVEATDAPGGTVVYDQTINLDATEIFDWWGYFFSPYDLAEEIVLTNLPPHSTMRLTVTLTGSTAVGCAVMLWGTSIDIGQTQSGLAAGIIDYSVKETDEFGTTTFVQRAFSKRMSAKMFLGNASLNRTLRLLAALRATPTVWIGSTDPRMAAASIVYGFYRDFSVAVDYADYSLCVLEIEGLT